MEKKYCKIRSHKNIPDHLITKQMCEEWGMVPVDQVYTDDGTLKKTIGNVYQYPEKQAPEIRFGPAYSNVALNQCAGIWDWAV